MSGKRRELSKEVEGLRKENPAILAKVPLHQVVSE
jgi:hypothetical protein